MTCNNTATGRPAALADHIARHAGEILRVDAVELDRSLVERGLDSLMALELRGRLERSTGLRVPTKVLWNNSSPLALAAYVTEQLAQPA